MCTRYRDNQRLVVIELGVLAAIKSAGNDYLSAAGAFLECHRDVNADALLAFYQCNTAHTTQTLSSLYLSSDTTE